MKISESEFTHFVMFINSDCEVEHSIGFEGPPNVASLLENFNELKFDEEFRLDNIESLYIDIINKEEYIEIMGDLDLEV